MNETETQLKETLLRRKELIEEQLEKIEENRSMVLPSHVQDLKNNLKGQLSMVLAIFDEIDNPSMF